MTQRDKCVPEQSLTSTVTAGIVVTQMRSEDERADNLLSRLFSYSPRSGREPLEDYCTEALAWCLRKSPKLLLEFLKLTKLEPLSKRIDPVEVHTQFRFKTIDKENPDDETGGRFDLVIESGVAQPFVLVVEAKVGSPFGTDQLKIYRVELKNSDAFEDVPQDARYLVTLTTMTNSLKGTDGSITWPEVHGAISQSYESESNAVVAEVLKQFALFLKEKGLAMLELKKNSGNLLSQWREVKELEKQLTQIVERLRNQEEIKRIVRRKRVESEEVWTGVYGKNDFFAGFGVLDMEEGPELFMLVEITVPGDQRGRVAQFDADPETKAAFENATRYQERFLPEMVKYGTEKVNFGKTTLDGNSSFAFAKQVAGKLDGDGEAVFQWLYQMSKKAIALAEQAKPTK